MYSGSVLSISPIKDMANCDIDIGNSGGKRGSCGMLVRHTTMVEALQRSPTAIQPVGLIQMDWKITCKGSDKGWNNGRFFIF